MTFISIFPVEEAGVVVLRRRAFCAWRVIASASSRMISLNAELMVRYYLCEGAEPEDLPCTCECLDLFSYDIDSSIITRVQFQYHLLVILAINLACNCQDRRRLSRPRWTIE
jgi:hypothetical protein